ncbi:MAG: 50S ribosomal protein L21 [Actinomycetota bacterium]
MYAVIRAGGKQHKVAKGDVIEVERANDSGQLEFVPLLIIDDKGKVRSSKSDLSKARVTARIVAETRGPKIRVMKFRNKIGYRRRRGHRQPLSTIEISDIKLTGARSKKETEESKDGT